jgi:biopolymer transport protein ExbB
MSAPQVGIKLAQLLESKQQEEALTLAQQQPQPCRNMWTQVLKLGLVEPELSDEVMNEVMLETQPKLERFLSLINVTAAIAPLLGLLGTVTGIIKTFEMMAIFGAGDPKPLIGGISEALITTELGLILAIPALLMSALLSRKAQSLLSKMERSAVAFSNARLTHQQKTSGESSPS